MYSNQKKIVKQMGGTALGGRLALWQEADGSKYLSVIGDLSDRFYGPLTDEQLMAYEVLCDVCIESDDWVAPGPLINVELLPRRVKVIDRKDVAVMGRRYRIHGGDQVMLTGYRPPGSRHGSHIVLFRLIDVSGSSEYEADISLFDLNSMVSPFC